MAQKPALSGVERSSAVRSSAVPSDFNYEDEDQRPDPRDAAALGRGGKRESAYSGPTYNSIENIAEFFASRGKKFTRPKLGVAAPAGKKGFRPGQKVRHPKYGEGTVYKREGEGDDAKITVQFLRFGLKKLVEKYAQLERV
jgi:DNA helicase-2/ATP-dependent DNA helicase PcrA